MCMKLNGFQIGLYISSIVLWCKIKYSIMEMKKGTFLNITTTECTYEKFFLFFCFVLFNQTLFYSRSHPLFLFGSLCFLMFNVQFILFLFETQHMMTHETCSSTQYNSKKMRISLSLSFHFLISLNLCPILLMYYTHSQWNFGDLMRAMRICSRNRHRMPYIAARVYPYHGLCIKWMWIYRRIRKCLYCMLYACTHTL